MNIVFNGGVNFESLEVGDFFLSTNGHLCLKIPEQEGYNCICFSDVTTSSPALHYYPKSLKCQKCAGNVVIY